LVIIKKPRQKYKKTSTPFAAFVALFFSSPLSSSPLVPEFSDGQVFSDVWTFYFILFLQRGRGTRLIALLTQILKA